MATCDRCNGVKERPCSYADRTAEYVAVLLPALRMVARRCGYALAVHGSLKTDIDLIACPWRESCISPASLAEKLRATTEAVIGYAEVREGDKEPTKKPCGRLAFSFYMQPMGCEGPYIDLSVMPQGPKPPPVAPTAPITTTGPDERKPDVKADDAATQPSP